jgi:hypothetical protein
LLLCGLVQDVAHRGAGSLLACVNVSAGAQLIAGFEVSINCRFWVSTEGICYRTRKINLSQVFAGQRVDVRQVSEQIWLVTFMDHDLGYFDDETCRLEPIENPFGPKVLPMSPE